MAKVDFPEGSSPFFNPAAYAHVHSELKKTKEKGKLSHTRAFEKVLDEAKSEESAELEKLDASPSEDALRELLDNVHESGEELKARPFPEEIKKYKAAVRSFLHYVVENGYTVEERMSGTNILKRKKFTLIQVVDRKLEQLAAGILAGQSSQLNILERIDEIAGLLIDLTR
ncbi:YaaR family protein [Treponema sp.]|jgi:uncharacterized protein YaaR (DUF327 family)